MVELKLDNINNNIKSVIEPYLLEMLNIHKDNIISINLYGSAAGQDFLNKKSDINLLIIFKELNFKALKMSLTVIAKGNRERITPPLFLTMDHIKTSQDVFPIEFLEMKENYKCIYGEDVLVQLDIKKDNLRFVCEEQIKGKLIRLRQAYLEHGLDKKGIELLMKESLSSLIPVFRNMLRVKGITPPIGKEDVLALLSEKFGLEKDVFIKILKDRNNDEKIAGQDIEIYFEKYLIQIQKLVHIIDTL